MNRSKFCIKSALGTIIAIDSKRASAQKITNEKFGKDLYKVFPSALYTESLNDYLKKIAKS